MTTSDNETVKTEVFANSPRTRWWRNLFEWALRYNFLLIFLAVVVIGTTLTENFLTSGNISNLFQQASLFGIIAIGMTFVILTGSIDLSVGSVGALGGMLVAVMMSTGIVSWLAIPATLVIGIGVGLLMGSITVFGTVPSFIVTLAGLVTFRGLTFLLSNGIPVGGLPPAFNAFGSSSIVIAEGIRIPTLGIVFICIAVIAGLVMRYTVFGEYVLATGGNREAARLSGVPVKAVTLSVFAISGLLSTLAGILLTSRLTIGQPTVLQGAELDAIAAVVLGGANLFGGRGTMFGTAIAVMLLQAIRNIFNLLGMGSFYQMTITGVIIVLAVLINHLIARYAGNE